MIQPFDTSSHVRRVGRRQYGIGNNGNKLTEMKEWFNDSLQYSGNTPFDEIAVALIRWAQELCEQVADQRRAAFRMRARAIRAESTVRALTRQINKTNGG